MSNKRYRRPANLNPASTTQPAPQVAAIERRPQAAPAMTAEDAALLGSIKRFLGKVLENACHSLDQLETTPFEQGEYNPRRMEWKFSQSTSLARIGISACRVLIMALKLSGADTSDAKAALKETVARLEQRIHQQAPELTPSD